VQSDSYPRLICLWRGRIVLSGISKDPRNWFMAAQGDPTNWNYAPDEPAATQAVAGNSPRGLGLIGDVVTGLAPYSDDVLFFGGANSLYMMRGDPMAGGQIDLVSDGIGMAWGKAWAKDPYGVLYFVSNLGGVYRVVPGERPVRISQQIDQFLRQSSNTESLFTMVWDDVAQGLHVFATPLTTATAAPAAQHVFWEGRSNAWWLETFTTNEHNPLATHVFGGNSTADRVALIGSFDGYVRSFSASSGTDDGVTIPSEVWIGPMLTKDFDELQIKDVQAVLGSDSSGVTWAVHVGRTAEDALASTAVASGTWQAGRNLLDPVRRAGHAAYVKITGTNPWAMEAVRARVEALGKVRRRG
jgi:hypothetical protein